MQATNLDKTELLDELLCALKIQEHMIKLVSAKRSFDNTRRLDAINVTIDELTAQLSNKRVLKAA